MPTTIQVSGPTKQALDAVKEQEHAPSYDQVIQHLLQAHTGIGKSMFGAAKGMRWKASDRMRTRDE
ncbi:MAG TPA: hypothetical protein VJH22_03135 [Candidatus Nanoarchaeia archaeon]|nr:hypothetical protein [Candidatus Nanoarchaeia archaeon]